MERNNNPRDEQEEVEPNANWCDTCGHSYEDNDMVEPGLCVYCQDDPQDRTQVV